MTKDASQLAAPFHERWIGRRYQDLLEAFPVVVVTGARQTGKTTLVRESPPSSAWDYLSFDDPEVRRQAAAFAPALWEGSREIVLDEVQRAPEVLSAVKLAVDADRSRRFVLTGSANLLLMKSVVVRGLMPALQRGGARGSADSGRRAHALADLSG